MVASNPRAHGETRSGSSKPERPGSLTIGSLSFTEFRRLLANGRLSLRTGPYSLRIRSSLPFLAADLYRLYDHHPCELEAPYSDYHVDVAHVSGLRRWLRPQVRFSLDGLCPFQSLPRRQALPLLEWGLNWCIADHGHSFLVIHAASLERDGRAIILPGPPGSGKSTLCAALTVAGWRLLSDELTLVSLREGSLAALSRPISLKNESIELIKARASSAVFSDSIEDTQKGTIALMKAPLESVRQMHETARPGWIVFPRFNPGLETRLFEQAKENVMLELARHSYNYDLYGREAFQLLINLVDAASCYRLVFNSLDTAIDRIAALT